MNDTCITIVGNVVDEPKLRETKSGVKVLSFRIASTSRRYDREQERWVDNESLFATVTCWRWLAENVAASLHKGQPVIATGKLYTREYRIDETVRASYELDAEAVGHDMARGKTQFTKNLRPVCGPGSRPMPRASRRTSRPNGSTWPRRRSPNRSASPRSWVDEARVRSSWVAVRGRPAR